MIKENDNLPEVSFFIIGDSGPTALKSNELFINKSLLIGIPGAFTPTCNDDHLPGFKKLFTEFINKGVNKIYVVATNDAFVLKAWQTSLGMENFGFLSDGNGQFRDKTGLIADLSVVGLEKRLSRFAMVIENGIVVKLFNENGPGLDVSKAEKVLSSI